MSEQVVGSGPILCDVDDRGVARLRLNRPEASNGLDVPLLRAFHDAVMACHRRPGLRVLLLSGEGKHFCAAGDVKTFASKGSRLPDYLREGGATRVRALGDRRLPRGARRGHRAPLPDVHRSLRPWVLVSGAPPLTTVVSGAARSGAR